MADPVTSTTLYGAPVGVEGAEAAVVVNTEEAEVQFPLALSPVAIKVVVVDVPEPVYS
jgi:hypothetical protein